MAYIQTKSNETNKSINIFYQEYGEGIPVVFIHGWPLNHEMWEYQLTELPKHNLRCIAYDRRGFGKSDRTWDGYDYDTFASDLNDLINQLNLNEVILVGFSMGGGEVARYIANYGSRKIAKVVLISSVTPFRLKTEDNPEGSEKSTFDETVSKIREDRPSFLMEFATNFYGVNMLNKAVSKSILDWNQTLCLMSSANATMDSVRAFSETDFRKDLEKIKVPTLVIHGDNDNIVPIKLSGDKTAKIISHASYKIYEKAPHGLFITNKEKLNNDLINFILN